MEDSNRYEEILQAHYGRANLSAELFEALDRASKPIATHRDTAAFDEFHMRGREATYELACLAGLQSGQRVLDLGCGLGGPARLLAAEFGCQVTGIDLIPEFIQVARRLAQMVGLEEKTIFQQGNMLGLPFEAGAFDVVWSQHTFMNIEDKGHLVAQIGRVLKAGGMLVLYEIFSGEVAPIHYPVQWASDPSVNFLQPRQELIELLRHAGFSLRHEQDVTQPCLEWFEALIAKMKDRPTKKPPPVGLNLVIGPSAAEKARNTARNLREKRIQVAYLVFLQA
jgi:ubiquinone/menaquinone biosynthesis C-methylase UbiE